MDTDSPELGATPPGLDTGFDGEVDFGQQARTLYATDASIYTVKPAGVAFPRHQDDVRTLVSYARQQDVSIIARGAGSSLTGNAIGQGIVCDCSRHLDTILDIDPDAKTVTVQPGVVLDELNDVLEAHNLYFPPDPSTSSTCTIGGMVANDAAGPHSLRHGTTRENVITVECVLADGTVATFGPRAGDELEAALSRSDRVGDIYRTVWDAATAHADEIDARYPALDRNSSGYDLHSSVDPDENRMDLSNLIVGSEGTLAIVTAITLNLTERPYARPTALVCYDDLLAAADAVGPILDLDPSVVELIDDTVLGYAREAWGINLVPPDAEAALLLEVESNTDAIADSLHPVLDAATNDATVAVKTARTDDARDRLWRIRKASNPLLNRRPGPVEAVSFIEDAAIPPNLLPEYLDRVATILNEEALEASVFGHAGQGVLHIKPFLNLAEPTDRTRLDRVSKRVHQLVLELDGAVSGEHGDGRLRSRYLPEMYGPNLYEAFQDVKQVFDPTGIFNPRAVIPADGTLPAPTDALRESNVAPNPPDTALDFEAEHGIDSLVDQCNGCSKCRTRTTDVMCPSFRALDDEAASTRGRANMLRAAIDDARDGTVDLDTNQFQSDVMDHCLACKACETECPTGVDMAKLKTEVKHQHHEANTVPLRTRLFAHVRTINRLGSLIAPMGNRVASHPVTRGILERLIGIDRRRTLPEFAHESFLDWYSEHTPASTAGDRGTVVLYPDCYTTYNTPSVGRAAVQILEALGYAVSVPDVDCCGRPALSQGLVATAREDATNNVSTLRNDVDADCPILSIEPSCTSALEDYDDLIDDPAGVPEAATTVAAFLYRRVSTTDLVLPETNRELQLAFHGHCHSSARGRDHAPVALLRHVGYDVTPLDSTCCGMAGAFGYKTEHYDLSTTLGQELTAQVADVDPDIVVASGASCSHQLEHFDVETQHPLVLLAEVVT